jgi:hypothetical protein
MAGIALRQQQTFDSGDEPACCESPWSARPEGSVFAARWQQLRVAGLAATGLVETRFAEVGRIRQQAAPLGEKAHAQCVGTTIAKSVATVRYRKTKNRRRPSKCRPSTYSNRTLEDRPEQRRASTSLPSQLAGV